VALNGLRCADVLLRKNLLSRCSLIGNNLYSWWIEVYWAISGSYCAVEYHSES